MRQGNPFEPNLCLDPVTLGMLTLAAVGTGVSVAGAAGAFQGDGPGTPPDRAAAMRKAESERRRRAMAQGSESTILGGASGPVGSIGTKNLLGQ